LEAFGQAVEAASDINTTYQNPGTSRYKKDTEDNAAIVALSV
jgi:hypothetical protein